MSLPEISTETLINRIAELELQNRQLENQWKTQCGVNRVTETQLMSANSLLSDLGYIRSLDGMSYRYDYEALK